MPGTWPTSATSRSSRPSICPSIDPQSTPSFTSSRPSPPTRSTRSSQSSIFSPAISSKQQPENPLSGLPSAGLRRPDPSLAAADLRRQQPQPQHGPPQPLPLRPGSDGHGKAPLRSRPDLPLTRCLSAAGSSDLQYSVTGSGEDNLLEA